MSISYPSHLHSIIADAEKNHFWFRVRRKLITSLIRRYTPSPNETRFCEIGFGTGELLVDIEQLGIQTTGIDINIQALKYAKGKVRGTLVRTSLMTYQPKALFDAVGLFDVLEHQKDDRVFLRHCARILKPGGVLYLNVPAGMYLWGGIDVMSGHIRRYTLDELRKRLLQTGFTISYSNYWNCLLLPFVYLRKFVSFTTLTPYMVTPPHYINMLLYGLLRMENILFGKIRLPYGASIIVVARKT